MKRQHLASLARVMMLIATFAMAATGFAHRFAQTDPSPDLLSYLSMGGTLDDICGDTDPAHLTGACDGCLIVANALLPRSVTSAVRPITPTNPAYLSSAHGSWQRAAPEHAHRARAPPLAVIA